MIRVYVLRHEMEVEMVKSTHKPLQTTKNENEWKITELIKADMIAFMITAILFIGAALLLTFTSLPENSIPVIAIVTTIISVLVAGYDTAKDAKSRGWLLGMSSGIVYAIILIVVGSMIAKDFIVTGNMVTLLIISAGGGALGGMIGINVKK